MTLVSLEPNSTRQKKSSSKEERPLLCHSVTCVGTTYQVLAEVPGVDDPGWNHRGIILVADVTVIKASEGTELGSYK